MGKAKFEKIFLNTAMLGSPGTDQIPLCYTKRLGAALSGWTVNTMASSSPSKLNISLLNLDVIAQGSDQGSKQDESEVTSLRKQPCMSKDNLKKFFLDYKQQNV